MNNQTVSALDLLKSMTSRFPPIDKHNHSLTIYDGKLQLNLVHTTPCEKVLLDTNDMSKPLSQLVAEISRLVSDEPSPAA